MNREYKIPGFIHRPGVHCTSTALRDIFEFNGLKMTEAMIFGLGSGMGMGYLKFRGQEPMIGGRQNNFEKNLAKIMNIPFKFFRTSKEDEGWNRLRNHLENGQPMAINIDMAYLDYHDDLPSEDFHFGMHSVVVCGYNAANNTVLIADTGFEEIQEITVQKLTEGRNAKFNRWLDANNFIYEFDFSQDHPDLKTIIPKAIRNNGISLQKSNRIMRLLGIHNGDQGIKKFSKDLDKWIDLSNNDLYSRARDIAGYISDYGTGGGFFRFLYSKFLKESAEIMEDKSLLELSLYYEEIGQKWENVSEKIRQLPQAQDKVKSILNIQKNLDSLIKKELQGAAKLLNYSPPSEGKNN